MSFIISFFKNEMKIKQKIRILQKSNPSLALGKLIIFPFIFPSHFRRSFELRSNALAHQPPFHTPTTMGLPPLPPRSTTLSPLTLVTTPESAPTPLAQPQPQPQPQPPH